MKPTVGRIVHYHPFSIHGDEPWAAIITKVVRRTGPLGAIDDFDVSITVFPPPSMIDKPCVMGPVPFGEKPGHWSWPPRE